MAVFPERMNRIDGMKTDEALSTIEEYINYMCEQLEFTVSNIKKNAAQDQNDRH